LVSRQPELRRQLRVMMNRYGGRLAECRRADDVPELLSSQRPDLLLLDLSGRDWTEAEVARFIGAHGNLPLVALVANDDELCTVAARDAGADDCVVVPIGSSEMLSRMLTALERSPRAPTRTSPDGFQAGALEIDLRARQVRLRGKRVHVTPTEYKLLRVLLESAGKVVTYERLLREVWGQAAVQRVQRLRIHMKQLQRKFELAPPFGVYVIAEPALGYRLLVPA